MEIDVYSSESESSPPISFSTHNLNKAQSSTEIRHLRDCMM